MSRKYTLEEVKRDFENKGYELLSNEYLNYVTKMDYICKKHRNYGIQQTTYHLLKTRINNCALCHTEASKGNFISKIDINGYVGLYLLNNHLANANGYVLEHRYEAEKILGRKLVDSEVVHHKDENRKNNSHDNLMVFKTNIDHVAFHKGCDIRKEGDVWVAIRDEKHQEVKMINKTRYALCPICKTNYKSYIAKQCSECRKINDRKNIPSKSELEKYIYNLSFIEIGEIYNVNERTIRQWCKDCGLPYRKKDIEIYKNKLYR